MKSINLTILFVYLSSFLSAQSIQIGLSNYKIINSQSLIKSYTFNNILDSNLNNSNNNCTRNISTNITYFIKSYKKIELGFSIHHYQATTNSIYHQETFDGSNNIEQINEQAGGYKGLGIGISINKMEQLNKIKFIYGLNFINSITYNNSIEGYFITIKKDIDYIFDKISFQKKLPNSIIFNPNLFIGATYEIIHKFEIGANLNYGQYVNFINGTATNTIITNGINRQLNTNYLFTNKDLEINKSTELSVSYFINLYLRYSLSK
jgi:hypothetical protein